jgi:hypothetical protein
VHRRFAALAASIFLINLNVVVVDRACGSRHDTTAPASEHAGHEHHAPDKSPSHDAAAKCCDAISSCGATLSLAGDVVTMDAVPGAPLMSPATGNAPLSLVRGPEPPPPKA